MLALVGSKNWRFAYYVFPGMIAVVISIVLLFLIKGKLVNEGLPPLEEHFSEVEHENLTSK